MRQWLTPSWNEKRNEARYLSPRSGSVKTRSWQANCLVLRGMVGGYGRGPQSRLNQVSVVDLPISNVHVVKRYRRNCYRRSFIEFLLQCSDIKPSEGIMAWSGTLRLWEAIFKAATLRNALVGAISVRPFLNEQAWISCSDAYGPVCGRLELLDSVIWLRPKLPLHFRARSLSLLKSIFFLERRMIKVSSKLPEQEVACDQVSLHSCFEALRFEGLLQTAWWSGLYAVSMRLRIFCLSIPALHK